MEVSEVEDSSDLVISDDSVCRWWPDDKDQIDENLSEFFFPKQRTSRKYKLPNSGERWFQRTEHSVLVYNACLMTETTKTSSYNMYIPIVNQFV